jgi:hypothetical protein
MKAKIIPIITLIMFFSLVFSSCEDNTLKEYKGYAPVYLSYKDLRVAVSEEQNVDLKNPGKIYFKDNYIFIVEELKGIHIYDNSNPSSPVKKTFINLPGVVDISIAGNIMYADSYIDLVVLDVENIDNIHEVGRLKDLLPYTVPAVSNTKFPLGYVDKDKGIVIDWELRTIKEKVDLNPEPVPYPVYYNGGGLAYYDKANSSGASSGISGSGVGMGGSMARFGIKDKALYVVDNSSLKVFNITDQTSPLKVNELSVGWNVETMFLHGNQMFLGTSTGMAILDITSPFSPFSLTFFTHATSCDPVIVDDTLAYITLRTGTTCRGNLNLLDIVSINDVTKPKTIVSYAMNNPHGLGKDGDLLFVCDGSSGLKVYNTSEPKLMLDNLIFTYPAINAFDVIPVGKVLVLIGDDGLYQYDYSNVKNITLLSKISVVK